MPACSSVLLQTKFVLRMMAALALLIVPGACIANAQQGERPFVVDGLGRATVPINGAWQFHTGDDLAWASPTFDDSSWKAIETGRPWEGQGYRDHTGFAWYRRRVVLRSDLVSGWDLAVSLSRVEDAAEVYWNGRRVGSYGKVPPNAVWYDNNHVPESMATILVLGAAADQARENVLAIRVWKAPYAYLSSPDMGGLTETPLLGNASALAAARTAVKYGWLHSNLYGLASVLVSSLVSLLALLTWWRDRRQWMLFWLAIYTLRPLALLLAEQLPGVTWRTGYGTVGMIYTSTDSALWFLLLYLLNLRENRRLVDWTRLCAYTVVGCQILEGSEQLFDWTQAPRFFLFADVGLTVPTLLLQVWPLVLIVFAVRKRLDVARWMVAIFGMLVDCISNSLSWFDLGTRWTHWTIADRIAAPLFTISGNPFSALTVASTLLLVSILYAVWRYEQERSQRQTRLNQDVKSVQELQQLLIPENLPTVAGVEISSAYRPAQEVGGDFFQVIPLAEGTAVFILGDVSGKGLHAAMTVALIVGALRSIVEMTTGPGEILSALNRRLYGRLRHGFATCLVLRLGSDGACVLANAGHLPPFVNGLEVELPNALPLGLLPEAEYESCEIQMNPGDGLTLYTDGLLEARNAEGDLFGFSRIAELLAEPLGAGQVADAAQRFGQEDDITVLTLRMMPARVAAEA